MFVFVTIDGNGECLCLSEPVCKCDVDPVSEFKYFERRVNDTGECLCNPRDCFNPKYPGVRTELLCALHDN